MNNEILRELREIHKELEEIKASCHRMDRHIGFVEYTYEGLKRPLNALRSYFKYSAIED